MAEHIQIGDISPRIQYSADGAQVVFTYPFPIFADADIEVYEDNALKNITTHYTVAGAGNSGGGTVTLATAPASGVVVTLRRNMAIERISDFQESGEFRAKVINDELDKLTATQQQIETDLDRSLRLGPTDSANSTIIPAKAARSSKVLGFDANGDPVVSTKDLADLETEADAAAASAAAALASEDAANDDAIQTAADRLQTGLDAAAASASADAAQNAANAGLYKQVIDKSGAYTIVVGDQGALIQVDTSGGPVTITLEALATLAEDFRIGVAKMTGDANDVTVQRSGADTINGATSIAISNQYEIYNFIGDLSDGQWLAANATITSLIGGDGIDKTGNTLSVDLDTDPGLEFNAGKLRAKVTAGVKRIAAGLGLDITGLTSLTAPATGDEIAMHDISTGNLVKMTIKNMLKVVNSLTHLGTGVDLANDKLLVYDADAGAVKTVNPEDIAGSGLPAPDYTSPEQTVTADTLLTVAHGRPGLPSLWTVHLRCKTAEFGWAIGDEIPIGYGAEQHDTGQLAGANATNLYVVQGILLSFIKRSTFDAGTYTAANWKWVFRAWD